MQNVRFVEEKELTEGLQLYEDLRTKFKASSHGIVKHKDPNRERQVRYMISHFILHILLLSDNGVARSI